MGVREEETASGCHPSGSGAVMKSGGLRSGRGCRAEGAAGEPQEVRATEPGKNTLADQAEGKVAA